MLWGGDLRPLQWTKMIDRQTDKPTTLTLAAHARRGLTIQDKKERAALGQDSMTLQSKNVYYTYIKYM